MQIQSKTEGKLLDDRTKMKNFADLMRALFYLVSGISIAIVMLMFVYVWQPIWVSGFQDFHTISQAINQLDRTAKPASETVPLMLREMSEMTDTMKAMHVTMLDMRDSMVTLEDMNPKMSRMTSSLDHMDYAVTDQMEQMTQIMEQINHLVWKMEKKVSPEGMMPYNW